MQPARVPIDMHPVQVELTGGGPLAVFVTFLLASAFYAVTLHLAATFYLGTVPSQRAAAVGPVLAAVSILLSRYGASRQEFVLVVVTATLVADLLAVSRAYRLEMRSALPLVLLHFGIAALLGVALANIFVGG